MQAAPFASLASYIDRQDIPALEFTVTNLRKPSSGVGQYGEWTMHGGEISDGDLRHDVVFTFEASQYVGKRLHVEAGRDGKGKLCGLVLVEKERNGEKDRQVKIDNRAKITVVDGATSSRSTSPVSSPSGQPAASPSATHVSKNGTPAGESTVVDRVEGWFRILDIVVARSKLGPVEFSASDLKEITTGISMSYKGQYGVYAPPYFGSETPEPQKEGNWEDFLYPAAGGKPARRMGDIPEADLLRYVTWALGKKEEDLDPIQVPTYRAIMSMAKAKDWIPPVEDDLDMSAPPF